MRGAGTDANVYLTLYGDKGKTDEVPIGNATDNFEQGQLDKFKVSFFMASVRNMICNSALLVKIEEMSDSLELCICHSFSKLSHLVTASFAKLRRF